MLARLAITGLIDLEVRCPGWQRTFLRALTQMRIA
jgi:hypothetical protein